MAKVLIMFTEDEVRDIKNLPPIAEGEIGAQTVEICGTEPAFLEAGIVDPEDYPTDVDLFVTTLTTAGWERHWLVSLDRESLEAGMPYPIFVD